MAKGKPFTRQYPREQTDALLSAILDYGLSIRAAVQAAADGRLPGNGALLEPFTYNARTLAHYATLERRRRAQQTAVQDDPSQVLRAMAAQLVAAQRLSQDRLLRRKAPATPAELRELARSGREVAAFAREAAGPRPRSSSTEAPAPVNGDAPGFIDGLAATG